MKKLLLSTVILTGCAQTAGYRPTVDLTYDPNAYRLQQDMMECEQLAKQAAGTAASIAGGTIVGGVVGAAGGAAIGAIAGNPLVGAAAGSTLGIAGGLYEGTRSDDRFRMAFKSCLRGRGHNPL